MLLFSPPTRPDRPLPGRATLPRPAPPRGRLASLLRRLRRRRSLGAALLPLLLLAGCGGGPPLERVERLLRQGQLEQARALLAPHEGVTVAALRERIEIEIDARDAALAEVEGIRSAPAGSDLKRLAARLEQIRERQTNSAVIEAVETALSQLADRIAESGVAYKAASPKRQREGYRLQERERERLLEAPRETDPLRAAILEAARAAGARADWAAAARELAGAARDMPAAAAEVSLLEQELRRACEEDLQRVLARAPELEAEQGPAAARAWLLAERARFEGALDLQRLDALGRGLEERAQQLVQLAARETPAHFDELTRGLSAPRIDALATQRQQRGELAFAAGLWRAAARASQARDAAIDQRLARALRCEWRAQMRARLLHAAEIESLLAGSGIEALEESGARVEGALLPWSELSLERLEQLVQVARLSPLESLGLLAERIARGGAGASEAQLAQLGRAVTRGWVGAQDAWHFVAEERGERAPSEGYVFDEGQWRTPLEQSELEVGQEARELSQRLRRAGPEQLEQALAPLAELARTQAVARAELLEVLARRLESCTRVFSPGALRGLERLADARRVLDERRAAALALIFDEERYFYPFRPPGCSIEKAGAYPAVQREVGELVALLRESWSCDLRVPLSSSFRAALRELHWLRSLPARYPFQLESLDLPQELPSWLEGIPSEFEEIGLAEFAWDAVEAAALRYNRRVLEYDEKLWETYASRGGAAAADRSEQTQVRITNEYRRMFGRRCLAWDSRLQVATRWHAEYMSASGVVGHDEPENPARATWALRMQSAGYSDGRTENCYGGSATPLGALAGWQESSGHHRNLLQADLFGMASAQVGRFWAVNFGANREFEQELDPWQD